MKRKHIDKLIGPDSPPDSVFRPLVYRLAEAGVKFERGRTKWELDEIAGRLEVPFPPDLREFWSTAWPSGRGWWDWRWETWTRAEMHDRITAELQHHVETGDIWLDSWGARPSRKSEAHEIVKQWVTKGPALLPLCSHRFAICEPALPNTPVLSIYGSDWIYYGWNLASYLEHEFLGVKLFELQPWPEHQPIGQWAEILDFGWPVLDEQGNVVQPAPKLPQQTGKTEAPTAVHRSPGRKAGESPPATTNQRQGPPANRRVLTCPNFVG